MIALLALSGCGPVPSAETIGVLDCDPLELVQGQVRARRIACNDEAPSTGDGRKGDVLLQNAALQVVLRNPWESLTRPGYGGGSLVDAAATGWRDRVLEAFPLVQDGFLDVADMALGADADQAWVTFTGTGVPFPPLGGGTTGTTEVTWRLPVDSQIVGLEGADGLWLRPGEGAAMVDAGFVLDGFAVLTDGVRVRDDGGALWLDGVSQLIAAPVDDAAALLWPDGAAAEGSCAGEAVQVWRGDALLVILGAEFATRVPQDALMVCVTEGSTAGDAVPPGVELLLAPGDPGGLQVRVADPDDHALPVLVTWDDSRHALPPGGGLAPIPPGTWQVTLDAGPAHDRWSGEVTVPGDGVSLHLRQAIDTSQHVLLELGRDAWPSWRSSLSTQADLDLAAAQGRDLVIHTPLDEVGTPETITWAARQLRATGGSLAETDAAGRVWSWSWSPSDKRAGHGAVAWQGLSPTDLLALAAGGDRTTAVDAAWVQAADPPWTWEPVPDLFRLDSLDDLPVLLDVLSHGVPLGVVGPLAWGRADTTTLPGLAALERDLVTGAACATTGPLLTLDQVQTGFADSGAMLELSLRLAARPSSQVSELTLYVDGDAVEVLPLEPGETAATLTWSGTVGRSAIGVATGEDWAVSAPIVRTP